MLKTAIIIPIPKSQMIRINNFRPISIVSIVSKIFEKALLKCTHSAFPHNRSQFWFTKNKLTTLALITICQTVVNAHIHNDMLACCLSFAFEILQQNLPSYPD